MRTLLLYTPLIIFSFINISFSQPRVLGVKEIKSGGDIIENYLTAIGGKNKLKEIHSYRINGTANFFGNVISYDEYSDSNKYYLNLGNDTIKVIKLSIIDTSRWVESYKTGEDTISVIDISDKHHCVLNSYFITYNFFYFFLNYRNYGLKIHFDSSYEYDKKKSYKITFFKSDSIMCTAVFDRRNFYLKNFIVEAPTENIFGLDKLTYKFDDYKEVNGTGIKLPFTIVRNEMVPIEISGYSFNKKIEDNLIQKPGLKK